MKARTASTALYHILAVCLSIVAVVPFLWMLSTSLKSSGALLALPIQWIPKEPTLAAYRRLFAVSGMVRSAFNSIVVTAAAVVVTLASASMAAFALAKIDFKARNLVFMFFVASMMIPTQVIFIPLYLIMNDLGMVNSLFALIVPYTFKAFAIFMLRQQMLGIPDAYLDAASIDGASLRRTFVSVMLPMCRTSLVTLAIITCMEAWNDYLLPLVLMTDNSNYTLPIILNSLSGQYKTAYDLLMAGSLISILPLLLVYVLAQKYFASGLQVGGIKG